MIKYLIVGLETLALNIMKPAQYRIYDGRSIGKNQ